MATCLREAATAEAGNATGGFFQPTLLVKSKETRMQTDSFKAS